ncbi:VOC family protein [Flaviaesturariibacter flavus]|uniref:VOC family protein n=1 Tax=Flaviaesturariibacter flavus TaxID=2502780 RepID=A0A4R1BNU8_9BACT|nr:VOC family protein [Flaviaesturariibacter flavus]TCJ19234.1 VOC family protein [Flaviaesturariibacter flavus]
MITRMNHVSVFVLDQESAYDFYVNKLGFDVHTDAPMGPGARWLTVCPPQQPELEISLMPVTEGMLFKGEAAQKMRELVKAGTFGFGVFECDDLQASYEELSARGVKFRKPPTREYYGYEALFVDDSGNWFSLGEKKKGETEPSS